MIAHAVFLDTMIYLEYRSFEQIIWHDALGIASDAQILIAVAGVTLREIDNHKNKTPRLRDRASRVAAQIEKYLFDQNAEIRHHTRLVNALQNPDIDFAATRLDPGNHDDLLIATALAYQGAHADQRVCIVTEDGYPRMQARTFGLEVLSLDSSYKLPSGEDALEKENRELKRQLQQMAARQPKLSLELITAGNTIKQDVTAPDPLSRDEVDAQVHMAAERIPPPETFRRGHQALESRSRNQPINLDELADSEHDPSTLAAALSDALFASVRIPDSELERYRTERNTYLAQYRKYLIGQRQFERDRARRIVLALQLKNDGAIPATDIDVHLHVPNGLTVLEKDILVKSPEPPAAPAPPKIGRLISSFDHVASVLNSAAQPPFMSDIARLADLARPTSPSNVSGLTITETESYDIRLHVGQVKHGLPVELPPFYLHPDDDAPVRSFQVDYSLYAANLPVPVEGHFNIVVTARAHDRAD